MKKKLVSALLCATMAASLLAGCGSGDTSDTGSSGKKGDAKTEVTNDGKILNIYCWNDEFQSRITDHYPDYKKVDATHGKIGDIDVVWNITPNENNAYQNNLDETLLKQADASAYDQGCNEEFQKAMKDYFEGNCDKDTAIETFKKAVIEKYPDLAE